MHSLKTKPAHSTHGGVIGSLRGDLAEIARKVHDATAHFDITVWTTADADVLFERADRTPDIGAPYVAGTYGVGSMPSDIESDLLALKMERVSTAMLCN
jgi:hypothetical protein